MTDAASDFRYVPGFGNHHVTEALPGALPQGQNSPQKVKYGLYAEQLSGSAFTVARSESLRTWCYRIRPSVLHSPFTRLQSGLLRSAPLAEAECSPSQMRWDPLPVPAEPTDFLEGWVTLLASGDVGMHRGGAAHLYAINRPMGDRFFYDADGELVFVPAEGALLLKTELGFLEVKPGEIGVVPRGVRFQIDPAAKQSRGYVMENYGLPFRLPYLGPIGANGLANPRDFLAPTARYEDRTGRFQLVAKFEGSLWSADTGHSPLDVVAWHGNYAPYKYDLARFNTVDTVSFDHPDPSIFTVLHSPSETPGMANLDFVIFPPRWRVAEHTFRPPYYHRNLMSEFMGLIKGVYDAKQTGFVPGGSSLHNCMSGHGPDANTFNQASSVDLKPHYMGDTLAFMLEGSLVFRPTAFAEQTPLRQRDYLGCWKDLKSNFNPKESS